LGAISSEVIEKNGLWDRVQVERLKDTQVVVERVAALLINSCFSAVYQAIYVGPRSGGNGDAFGLELWS
jgi:ssDNA-specific exonuclease RecJ